MAMPGEMPAKKQTMGSMDMSRNGTGMSTASSPVKHGPDRHGKGNTMVAESPSNRLSEPGDGLENNGRRVFVYTDLRSLSPYPDQRPPEREVELHLTGVMNRYMWSFDGKKFSEVDGPVRFKYGERLESPRDCRRPFKLRGYSDVETNQIRPVSPGTGGSRAS